MIAAFRNWLHQRALTRAVATCADIAGASDLAAHRGDHAAARYFEAELQLALNRLRALRGHPNPGRYCCDGNCSQGRRCVLHSLPNPPRKVTT